MNSLVNILGFTSPLQQMMAGTANSLTAGYAAYNQALADNYSKQWNAMQANMSADAAESKARIFRQLAVTERFETEQTYDTIRQEQRSAYASSGVNVDYGSAIQVQAETAAQGVYEGQKAEYQRIAQAIDLENQAKASRLDAQFGMNSQRPAWMAGVTGFNNAISSVAGTYSGWQRQSGNGFWGVKVNG